MSLDTMDVVKDDPKPSEEASLPSGPISPSNALREKSPEPPSVPTTINGRRDEEEDDDNGNEELTPPPDSPVPDPSVNDSASNDSASRPAVGEVEQDEIVVGTKSRKKEASSPRLAGSDRDAVDMEDTEVEPEAEAEVEPEAEADLEPEEKLVVTNLHKRKRASIVEDDDDDTFAGSPTQGKSASPPRLARGIRNPGINQAKGIVLGFWRDSQPEDPKNKHAVIGFIDIRDRLRTRIQTTARDGRNISHEYPVPPGPGGSWVTFDRIAFDDHLVNLDHFQVKEFVKLRLETVHPGETPEEKAELDKATVKQAIQFLQANPPNDNAPANLAIAYGPQIPEHARLATRPDKKRRTGSLGPQLMGSPGGLPPAVLQGGAPGPAPSHARVVDNLPGTRPTRILLGYWNKSSETAEVDKHAVYGILGANDMFRVKLMKETRDGRPLMGNFPTGPGALWIHWDEVVFEPHLANLSRPEIKEYCRVRQRHFDDGERPEHRAANEVQAINDARKRVESGGALVVPRKDEPAPTPMPILRARESPAAINGNGYEDGYDASAMPAPPLQPKQHEFRRGSRPRHSLPDVELRAANRPQSSETLERTNNLARREVARLESSQARRDQHEATREAYRNANPAPNGTGHGDDQQQVIFKDHVQRMNKVWAAQEQSRQKAGVEDAKVYNGVKYERKQTGPFQGKLVSQGKIISIDGEDYVEYRVLTKPSFF
ncbi:hypothetical protein GQ53DRAFT_816778 [Thozetella sp. PMI_491]|nr:hypothetical protein GQ53DRAFT_816778 [Thozetella sp. PMI_491]